MTRTGQLDTAVGDLTRLLTEIARASLRDHETADLASIITEALAGAAANVGGPEALLAARPGSWEAAHLRTLLEGTMGDRPELWWSRMTEPVTVYLNVAALIEDADLHPELAGLDQAQSQLVDNDPIVTYDTLTQRYEAGYALYAEHFTATVQAIAREMHLPMPPHVIADTDPLSVWWDGSAIHNSIGGPDQLAAELWEGAHAAVPLPNVDTVHSRIVGEGSP